MLPLSDINLGTGFKKYFRIASALNEEQKNDVYRVRHAVYCEDLGFEPVRSDHREIDRYNAQSVHCLLSTAEPPHLAVGCARLVLCDPNEPAAPLPFESTCAGALDRSIVDTARLPRQRIGEVSRLAVTKRGTETDESLQKRITKAELELTYKNKFEGVIVNENFETACDDSEKLVLQFIHN